MARVLVGAPVRQRPEILSCYLESLAQLDTEGLEVDFCLVDDNVHPESRRMLAEFRPPAGRVTVLPAEAPAETPQGPTYQRDGFTHVWTEEAIWRVAGFKNRIIQQALGGEYDYLFLVDSDLVLHPLTLKHLISCEKDIVAEIFWTRWTPDQPELPQVWLFDQYSLHPLRRGVRLTPEQIRAETAAFLAALRQKGLFEVGGLGACTLIRRVVLEAGAHFGPLSNVSFWGEDRHFCIRAVALGFRLYVDTHLPALHLYRDEQRVEVPAYRAAFPRMAEELALLQAVRAGLEAWGTRDYRTSTGLEGLEHFAPELQQRLRAEQAQAVALARERRWVVQTCAGPGRVLQLEGDTALAEVEVTQEGLEREQPFRERWLARVSAVRQEGRWRIASVEFLPGPETLPGLEGRPAERERITVPVPVRRKARGNKLTLSMVVRNEADRYLKEVLAHAAQYVDEFVILDDASEDETPELCLKILRHKPLLLFRNPQSLFDNEILLRKKQWELTLSSKPDWILFLDADEIFEDRIKHEIRDLIDQDMYDVICFRLHDFWDMEHYREDAYWRAHPTYRPFLLRYRPDFPYRWRETALHCGRMPANVLELPTLCSDIRVKHLGWARPEDRLRKYRRYMERDPEGRYGSLEQYRSILDPHPRLIR